MTAIAVLVGTDHHPFDRVVQWADDWQRHHPEHDVMVQHGHSAPPEAARAVAFMEPQDLKEFAERSDVVITHGGPGTLMTARANGRLPILVPRDPRLGEHVDSHQMRFARWVSGRRLAVVIQDVDVLGPAVEAQLVRPVPVSAHRHTADASQALAHLIEDIRRSPRDRPTLRRQK